MKTAEYLANAILSEKKGIFVILWEDKGELIRALLIILSVIRKKQIEPILLSSAESVSILRKLFDVQPFHDEKRLARDRILTLFLQQAASRTIGPWLNGWRSPLADEPGSLLVIRSSDFIDFQRNAPDLSGYIGPKIADTSKILSIWNNTTADNLKLFIPDDIRTIIDKLPGENPPEEEIQEWILQHSPIEND
ncbi:hypothetical protein QUF80_05745 [Desulfococcaceae bacterium HSG8]|nr:hypothetical protein [Desulfococcaceae bacterium HSG8]